MLVDDDNKQEHIRLRTRRFNYGMSKNFVVHQHMEWYSVICNRHNTQAST